MMGGIFILIGIPILVVGLTMLLRPAFVRGLLGVQDSETATYVLRIAGMMAAAFGLILAAFSLAYRLAEPAR